MTANRKLKRLVRARAAKTGESYTAALRNLRTSKEAAMPPNNHGCWFCQVKAGDNPDRKFFVGAGTTICSDCVERLHELIPKEPDPTVPKTQAEAIARYSDDELLDSLKNYAATFTSAEEALRHAVLVRRSRGIGWDRIAAALDLTQESAEARFKE